MQNKSQSISSPCITLQYFSSEHQSTKEIKFPLQILNFNIQLLNHNNHQQPYPIPQQILTQDYPFLVIKQFVQEHNYTPQNIKITKPITSKNYSLLVDPITFKVCQKFTSLQNCQLATKVVTLCRFLRFHQLRDAICCAIATNYFIEPNNQKQLALFKKVNKIQQLSSEEVCQIIKEYEDVFMIIDAKAKAELLKTEISPNNYSEQEHNIN